MSTSSSSAVSRSISKVARLARFSTSATNLFRGLWRLLPLPCAKTTAAFAFSGNTRSPWIVSGPRGILTVVMAPPPALSGSPRLAHCRKLKSSHSGVSPVRVMGLMNIARNRLVEERPYGRHNDQDNAKCAYDRSRSEEHTSELQSHSFISYA